MHAHFEGHRASLLDRGRAAGRLLRSRGCICPGYHSFSGLHDCFSRQQPRLRGHVRCWLDCHRHDHDQLYHSRRKHAGPAGYGPDCTFQRRFQLDGDSVIELEPVEALGYDGGAVAVAPNGRIAFTTAAGYGWTSGSAARLSKVVFPSAAVRSGAAPSVDTGPAATAFTRTPLWLNSAAHARVIDARAAFVAP